MDIPATKPRTRIQKSTKPAEPLVQTPEVAYGTPKKEPVNQSIPPVPVKETLAKEKAKKEAGELLTSYVANPINIPIKESAKLAGKVASFFIKPVIQSGINVKATLEQSPVDLDINPLSVNNVATFGAQFLGRPAEKGKIKPVSELLDSPLGAEVNKRWFEGNLKAYDVSTGQGLAGFGADLFTVGTFYYPVGSVARTGSVEVTKQLFRSGLVDDVLRLTDKGKKELIKKGEIWFGDKVVRAGKEGVAEITQATTKDWFSGIAKGAVSPTSNPYIRGLAAKNAIYGTWDFAGGVALNVLDKKSRGEEIDPEEALTAGILNAAAPYAFSGAIRTLGAGQNVAKRGLTRLGELGDELVEQSRTTVNVKTPFGITDRLKPENRYRATTDFSGVKIGKDWLKDTTESVKRVIGNILRTIGYAPSSSYARLVNAVNHAEAYIGNRKEWSPELAELHTDAVYAFVIRRDYGSWVDSIAKTYGNSVYLASGGKNQIIEDGLQIASLLNEKKRVQKGFQQAYDGKIFTEQEIDDSINAIRNRYGAEDNARIDKVIEADNDLIDQLQGRTIESGAMSEAQLEQLTEEWGDAYRKQYSEMYGGATARRGKDSPMMKAEGTTGLRVDPMIARLAFINERVSLIIDTELKKSFDRFFMQAHKEFPNAFPMVTLRTPEMKQARIDVATKIKSTKELIGDVRKEMTQTSKSYEGQEKRILAIQDKIDDIEEQIDALEKSIADDVSTEFGALTDEAVVRAKKVIDNGYDTIKKVKEEFSSELKAVNDVERETKKSFSDTLKSIQNSLDITLGDITPKKLRVKEPAIDTAESRLVLEIQALRGENGELERAYIDALERTELASTSGFSLPLETKYNQFSRIMRRNPRLLDLDIEGIRTSDYVKSRPELAREINEEIFVDKTGKMSDDEVYQMFRERMRREKEAPANQAKADKATIKRYENQEKRVQKALSKLEDTNDKNLSPLVSEDRKHNTAEEFVKAQGTLNLPFDRTGQLLTKNDIGESFDNSALNKFIKDKFGGYSFSKKRIYNQPDMGGNIYIESGNGIYSNAKEFVDKISLQYIEAGEKGTGLGKKYLNTLREYSDKVGKPIYISDIANPKFFNSIVWLDDFSTASKVYFPEETIKLYRGEGVDSGKSGFFTGKHFTTNKNRASGFGEVSEQTVTGRFFDLSNDSVAESMVKKTGTPASGDRLSKILKEKGYDGIKRGDEYILFEDTKPKPTNTLNKANVGSKVVDTNKAGRFIVDSDTVKKLLDINKRLIEVQAGKKSAQESAKQIASDVKKIVSGDKKLGKELDKVGGMVEKQKELETRYKKLEEVEGGLTDDLLAYRDELRSLDKQVTLRQATKMVTPVRESFKTDKEYRQALRVYNDIQADKEGGMSTYSYFQNGEKVVRAVPTEMLRMFNADRALGTGVIDGTIRKMATLNNLFKNSTTRYNPIFAFLRNPRDWAGAYINHGLAYADFAEAMTLLYQKNYTPEDRQLFDALGTTAEDVFAELRTVLGGIQANVLDKDLAVMNKKIESYIQKKYARLGNEFAKQAGEKRSILSVPGDFFGTYFKLMDKANMFVEQMPKAALFAKVLTETGNMKEAIIRGRQASVDYDVIGSLMVTPNRLINFINAAIQGTDITIRAMKQDPTGWFRRAMKLNYISQLVRYNNNRYGAETNNNISSNDKINFWNIIYGTDTVIDKDGKLVDVPLYIKIPKPDAFKIISTPYEYLMDIEANENKRKMDRFLWDYVGSTIPLSFSSVPINVSLAGYAAGNGNAVNPFTGYSVIDPRFQDVVRKEQYTNTTNPGYKAIANLFRALGDNNALRSPMYMEYLLKNSLGTGVTSLIEVLGSSYSATKAIIDGDVDAGDFTNTSVYKSVVGTGRPMTDPEVSEAVKEANQITRTRNSVVKRAIENALKTMDKNEVLDALRDMPEWESANDYERKKMFDVAKSQYRNVMIGSVRNKQTSTLSGTELYYYAIANWGLDNAIANYVSGNKSFLDGIKEKVINAKVSESAKNTLVEMINADIVKLRNELPKM